MAGQMTILVAEDDPSMRRAIGRLLKAAGFYSIEFGSAEALLQSPDLLSAACVVTDVHLPAMSGFDLIDGLRQRSGPVPAVFITAFDKPDLRRRASSYSNAAYLTKPFEGMDLLNAVQEVTAAGPGTLP